jgi:cryptochrome
LVFEKDVDAYAAERDEEVKKLARDAGVEVIVKSGRTLWDSDEIVKKNGGKPTMSMSVENHDPFILEKSRSSMLMIPSELNYKPQAPRSDPSRSLSPHPKVSQTPEIRRSSSITPNPSRNPT